MGLGTQAAFQRRAGDRVCLFRLKLSLGVQDVDSFRARLDDHHILLTNQTAGVYYIGVYNNDNFMKVSSAVLLKRRALCCIYVCICDKHVEVSSAVLLMGRCQVISCNCACKQCALLRKL